IQVTPGSRFFLLDLDSIPGAEPRLLSSAGKVSIVKQEKRGLTLMVEGVADTPSVLLLRVPKGASPSVTLAGEKLDTFEYSAREQLLWIRFGHESSPRELVVKF